MVVSTFVLACKMRNSQETYKTPEIVEKISIRLRQRTELVRGV